MAERFVWTSADGVSVVDLTDQSAGFSVLANGTRGLRAPAYAFTSDEYAGVDGSVVQSVRATASTPTLGLLLEANSAEQFASRARGLIRAMRPKAGPGTLTVTRLDGSTRALTCYVTEGLEGDEAVDVTLPGAWWKMALKLYAPDPWWYGSDVTTAWGLTPPPAFFPLLPVKLGMSAVQGTRMVDNAGDEDAFGRWSITGPGTGPITLANVTTGRSITVSMSLAAGRTLLVDTRPGFQTVTLDDGTNMFGSLTSDPSMWSLAPGLNEVSVAMGNATADSQVLLAYAPRYPGIT